MALKINSDGGARGNPGPAGIGVVIEDQGELVAEISQYIGETTNNQAEYKALIAGLEWVEQNREDVDLIECSLDSELVVRQLIGQYKVRNEEIRPLYEKVCDLVKQIGSVKFTHIPRERNKLADKLVNKAIDNKNN